MLKNHFVFKFWVCSAVVERYVDIVEVASSILAIPTKILNMKIFSNEKQKKN